jgi:hypothetical protein
MSHFFSTIDSCGPVYELNLPEVDMVLAGLFYQTTDENTVRFTQAGCYDAYQQEETLFVTQMYPDYPEMGAIVDERQSMYMFYEEYYYETQILSAKPVTELYFDLGNASEQAFTIDTVYYDACPPLEFDVNFDIYLNGTLVDAELATVQYNTFGNLVLLWRDRDSSLYQTPGTINIYLSELRSSSGTVIAQAVLYDSFDVYFDDTSVVTII